ncbi:MAG: hypothetical protein ABIF71_12110 [Planctomycetota bacterium]
MTRIEQVVREINDLRRFYLKISQLRLKSPSAQTVRRRSRAIARIK